MRNFLPGEKRGENVNQEGLKVSVQIFGELHVIRGKGSEEHILRLARDVDKRMREISLKFPRLAAHQVDRKSTRLNSSHH